VIHNAEFDLGFIKVGKGIKATIQEAYEKGEFTKYPGPNITREDIERVIALMEKGD